MPLTYRDRGTSGTQLDIISGKAVVGFLWKAALSRIGNRDAHWAWAWHSGPASDSQQYDTADTIEAAKAKLEEQWRAWLDAAGLVEK